MALEEAKGAECLKEQSVLSGGNKGFQVEGSGCGHYSQKGSSTHVLQTQKSRLTTAYGLG